MTTFLSREHHSYSLSNTNSISRKKIKHFSYSASDRIGKGYSSVVYRGKNDNTDETVAIKAIDMKGVKDRVSREMLDCEIQALTKLNHPNILKCYEVVRESAYCYIITEFCSQGDLGALLKKRRKIPESEVLSMMKDIVSGYLEIGDNKFLHRDLKLANILINEKGVAKIADFGFAKKSFYQSEKEKYNVGSPLYMSPEALKRNIYSIKNDIWSIGIMIFELLHGQTPWDCKTEAQLIDKMTRVPVKFKSSITVSETLKDFIKKCLEVNEGRRMSLKDLRDWIVKHDHHRSHSLSEKHTPILDKKYSANENVPMNKLSQKEIKPLGDATNRLSVGVQKNRSYSHVLGKASQENKSAHNVPNSNKQNFSSKNLMQTTLPKPVIEKNNSLVLVEINKFRLMFKIYEKIKKCFKDEQTLLSTLGTEIFKRVENVASVLLDGQDESGKKMAQKLGVKEVQSYTKEDSNQGIKKYKAVIKEYQRKYNDCVKITVTSSTGLNQQLKKFAAPQKMNKDMSKDENTLFYWIFEMLTMSSMIKKDALDSIIEGKRVVDPQTLAIRFKSFS